MCQRWEAGFEGHCIARMMNSYSTSYIVFVSLCSRLAISASEHRVQAGVHAHHGDPCRSCFGSSTIGGAETWEGAKEGLALPNVVSRATALAGFDGPSRDDGEVPSSLSRASSTKVPASVTSADPSEAKCK